MNRRDGDTEVLFSGDAEVADVLARALTAEKSIQAEAREGEVLVRRMDLRAARIAMDEILRR